MQYFFRIIWVLSLSCSFLFPAALRAERVRALSQHGITWTFDREVESGTFCNGDFWVVGPVKVVGISNNLHAPGFQPQPGQNGSMVNPGTDGRQGYDNRLNSYDASRNAALPKGQPLSPANPLELKAGSSLVSMVSWLWRSQSDAEPGIPGFNASTKAPRPVTRSAAVLTVLPVAPPPGSFRPPYAGDNKQVKFNVSQLKRERLPRLTPVRGAPNPAELARQISRPWIDHVNEYLGAMIHPSENMPNYGREMALLIYQSVLTLTLDFSKLPGRPDPDTLLIPLVQMGIDFAGIADHGGGWPANGGHQHGRKLPILFAGHLLDDAHLLNVGKWETRFQEDEQTFFVDQAAVKMTNSSAWAPDKRGGSPEPYTTADIGMAEWGIRHRSKPESDNREWGTPYRDVNAASIPGFALAARLLGLEQAWNHPPLFAYAERIMEQSDRSRGANAPAPFLVEMWKTHLPRTP